MIKSKILGYGEIGKSLAEVYRESNIDIAWKDLNQSYGDEKCDLLNVCIPYSSTFSQNVSVEIFNSECEYVVIHSTIPPGTTTLIKEMTNKIVCHSPVIGVHPNLKESMLTFTKWFGGGCSEIIDHFKELGMNAIQLDEKPEATEIMKLWDTTYYGLCLSINAEVNEMLEKYSINYDEWVYYLQEYNLGYIKMGMPNVVRPYFKNLKMPIGGHCVIPNYKILTEKINDPDLLKLLKKYS